MPQPSHQSSETPPGSHSPYRGVHFVFFPIASGREKVLTSVGSSTIFTTATEPAATSALRFAEDHDLKFIALSASNDISFTFANFPTLAPIAKAGSADNQFVCALLVYLSLPFMSTCII
jgi:hypothetical protein